MLIMFLTPAPIEVRGITELTQLICCHEMNCEPVYYVLETNVDKELRYKLLLVSTVWEFSAEMQVI
jgi:hypothetical protein